MTSPAIDVGLVASDEPDIYSGSARKVPDIRREVSAFLRTVARSKIQDEHAEKVYKWAVQLDPQNFDAWNELGAIAMARRDAQQALQYFGKALNIEKRAAFWVNYAVAVLAATQSYETCLKLCDEAIQCDPSFMGAYIQKTSIYIQLLQHEKALLEIEAGLKVDPSNDVLHFMRGVIGLTKGENLTQAWEDYDHRAERRDVARILSEYTEWHGEPLQGKTLLVYGEQGIGDQIMFARYLPQLDKLSGKIVLYTHQDLARLLDAREVLEFDGTEFVPLPRRDIIVSDRELAAVQIDCWIGSSSLARYCKPVSAGPYLSGRRYDDERFRALVSQDSSLKIGLCWAGSPRHPRDEYRSLAYSRLGPLLNLPGVTPYALQYGPASEQSKGEIPNLANHWRDLAEAAAILQHLDVVITVDTSIAHLAGALGIPVWVMLAQGEEWRWGIKGSTTPWYSSMRLFRQPSPGDWDTVIEDVKHRLLYELELHALKPPRTATYLCSVCNWAMDDPPRDWNICPCCGIEFEYDDAGIERGLVSCQELRERWKTAGMKWFSDFRPAPPGWNPAQQLAVFEPAIVTKPCRYGEMSFYRKDRAIGAALNFYGEWSEAEVELFRDLLKPGDVVVEAGANIGSHTIPLAQIVGERGRVLAFEPQPEVYELLLRNVRANAPPSSDWSKYPPKEWRPVTVWDCALGKSTDDVFLAPFDGENPGGCAIQGFAQPEDRGRIAQQTRLDRLGLNRLEFLKADVEGMEIMVLEGAKETIERCRPLIYVENDRPGATELLAPWLDKAGYRLYQHHAPLYNMNNFNNYRVNVFGSTVSFMLLAVPQERYGFTKIIEKHELKRVIVKRK